VVSSALPSGSASLVMGARRSPSAQLGGERAPHAHKTRETVFYQGVGGLDVAASRLRTGVHKTPDPHYKEGSVSVSGTPSTLCFAGSRLVPLPVLSLRRHAVAPQSSP
jgi:hypothetical protein